jgi:phage baseplate assembly protein W
MTVLRFRAPRFLHPDLDVVGEYAGMQISPTGRIAMVDEERSVRQSLLLLLSTSPGERVMRPEYGCDLNRLVFSPNDDTTAGLAIHYVRRAVSRWERRIEVLRLDAVRSPEAAERLEVLLEYRVRATRRVDRLVVPVNLAGGPV